MSIVSPRIMPNALPPEKTTAEEIGEITRTISEDLIALTLLQYESAHYGDYQNHSVVHHRILVEKRHPLSLGEFLLRPP